MTSRHESEKLNESLRIFISKQNRSTEECSKLKRFVDMTRSGKNGLNIRTNASPKMGQDQVSGEVSVLCMLASRTRCSVLWKPPKFCNKAKIGNKSSSVISS